MQKFHISGGRPLQGEIAVSGAKNSVLPILAACTLCRGVCVLHNCPEISDVEHTVAILRALGAQVQRRGSTLAVDPSGLCRTEVPPEPAGKMRSSVLFLGALLSAAGSAAVPLPGGCPLGKRPVDLHLRALEALGADCRTEDHVLRAVWRSPHAAEFTFPAVSVGATENAILAALACPGETVLRNAACEPEITDLVRFLRSAGAQIEGGGTRELRITGGQPLHGTTYTVVPDRIETATFLCAAAGCGGDVLLRRTRGELLLPVADALRQAGCELTAESGALRIRQAGRLRPLPRLETAVYPGFPTDCQAPLTAALLRARGESRMTETLFENRFHHVPELLRLGADLRLSRNTVCIRGVPALHGTPMTARDLRGGAALVLAALQAEGESTVSGLDHIDRGYAHLEEKLRALGARITRSSAG